jgi:hypothetical protein
MKPRVSTCPMAAYCSSYLSVDCHTGGWVILSGDDGQHPAAKALGHLAFVRLGKAAQSHGPKDISMSLSHTNTKCRRDIPAGSSGVRC